MEPSVFPFDYTPFKFNMEPENDVFPEADSQVPC